MPSESQLVQWPVGQIDPDPVNPRSDLGDLAGLAQSIAETGLLQPIVARTHPDDPSRVIIEAGHRRHAAVVSLGWTHVDVIVAAGAGQGLVGKLVENIQREDLTPIDEALGYQQLVAAGLSQRQIATKVGRSQPTVSKRLGLLKLPDEAQQWVTDGSLAVDLAAVLASLPADTVVQLCTAGPPTEAGVVDARRRVDAAKRAELETRRLAGEGVTVVTAADVPHGSRRVGAEWNRIHVDVDAHQAEPCSVAVIGAELYSNTATVDWWCTDPARHQPGGASPLTIPDDGDQGGTGDAAVRTRPGRSGDDEEVRREAEALMQRREDLIRRRRARWVWLANGAPLPDDWAADAATWMVTPAAYDGTDATVLVDRLGLNPADDLPRGYGEAFAAAGGRLTAWAADHGHDRLLWLMGCLMADVVGDSHLDDEQRDAGRRWLHRLAALGYHVDQIEWDAVGGPDDPAPADGGGAP